MLEAFVEGQDLRIVMIDYKVVAATIRRPAEVTGTGKYMMIDGTNPEITRAADGQGNMIGMASVMRDSTARFEEMKSLRRRIAERRIAELENAASAA